MGAFHPKRRINTIAKNNLFSIIYDQRPVKQQQKACQAPKSSSPTKQAK
jgi:hypothetical protein